MITQGAAEDGLLVERVRGTERISRPFELEVRVREREPGAFDEEAALYQPASLLFSCDGAAVHQIHGLVSEVRDVSENDAEARLVALTLVPRLHAATMRETLDIFMDLSVPEIIAACLERAGLVAEQDFVVSGLAETYPKREFVVQYKESDLAFLSRLAEHLGVFYFFDHTGERDVVVFGDRNAAFPSMEPDELLYGRENVERLDVVTRLESQLNPLPRRYVVRDYNYRIPGVDLMAEAIVDERGVGEVIEYGAHFKSPDEGSWLAEIRAQELRSRQRILHGWTSSPGVFSGGTVRVSGHPRGDVELLVTEVDHDYSLVDRGGDLSSSAHYRSRIRAIPQSTPYRPERLTPKPRVSGVVTGIVDAAAKGDYAELDGDGRYQVRFLFDTASRGEGQASRPVRMSQPHAGEGYGMHFPLRPGVEVAVTCVDGDPDRPIISGTVPNPSTASPVSAGNNARNVIRTGGGNEINIDDTDGEHRIKMTTPFADTLFQMGAPNEPNEGYILKTAGDGVQAVENVAGVSCAIMSLRTELAVSKANKNIIAIAGEGSPLEGFAKFQKFAQTGLKAAGAAVALTEKALGTIDNWYADDAEDAPSDEQVAVLEKRCHSLQEQYKSAKSDGNETRAANIYADLSGVKHEISDMQRVRASAKNRNDAWLSRSKAYKEAVAGVKSMTSTLATVDKLVQTKQTWGRLKSTMAKIDEVAELVTVEKYVLQAAANVGTRMILAPPPATQPVNIQGATSSAVVYGDKNAYLFGGMFAWVFGKKFAGLRGGLKAKVNAGRELELQSKTVLLTASTILDVLSKGKTKIHSKGRFDIDVEDTMDIRVETIARLKSKKESVHLEAKKTIEVQSEKETTIEASSFVVQAKDDHISLSAKKKYSMAAGNCTSEATDGAFKLDYKDETGLELTSGVLLRAGSTEVALSKKLATVTSGDISLDASGNVAIDCGELRVKGRRICLG